MSGEDPYAAYRRIMEANLDELSTLMDMGETERELYFHKKKDELHGNVAKKRQEKIGKEQAFNQAVQKVDSLRQTYNVTEDGFVDASEELESIYKDSGLDTNSITDEAIVDYASLKPHITKVKELIEPYEDNISEGKYGDVVAELSRYLRDVKADEATVKSILKRNFSVEEDVKELNTKVYQKGQKSSKVALQDESELSESFADWD
jgi:glutaredoxin 2